MSISTSTQQTIEDRKLSDELHSRKLAAEKDDSTKQVPAEVPQQLDGMLMAIEALNQCRQTTEEISATQANQISVEANEMNTANNELATMSDYAQLPTNLTGNKLEEAIENVTTTNEGVDARRGIVESQIGNMKLDVQQKESEVGANVNAVVQDLQQAASMIQQLGQLSNTVSGR